MRFAYEDFAEAPVTHKSALRALVVFQDRGEAAKAAGVTPDAVKAMMGHPPFRAELERRFMEVTMEAARQTEQVRALFEDVLLLLREGTGKVLEQIRDEEVSPTQTLAAVREALRLFEKLADRMPDGNFAHVSRTENRSRSEVLYRSVGGGLGGEQIEALRERARLVVDGDESSQAEDTQEELPAATESVAHEPEGVGVQ